MSAQLIYDLAPLGSLVRFSDGTPRPPERHRKKLAAWEHRNSGGRLIRKQPERRIATRSSAQASRCIPATMAVAVSWCFAFTGPSRSIATWRSS